MYRKKDKKKNMFFRNIWSQIPFALSVTMLRVPHFYLTYLIFVTTISDLYNRIQNYESLYAILTFKILDSRIQILLVLSSLVMFGEEREINPRPTCPPIFQRRYGKLSTCPSLRTDREQLPFSYHSMSDVYVSPNDNLYQFCVNKVGDATNTSAILICFSDNLSNDVGAREYSRTIMIVYAAGLVFFMQAGFAMVCAGAVRQKNLQNTMLKNLLDACGAAVAFFTVGYAFAFGGQNAESPDKSFVGYENFFLVNVDDYAFWLFQYAFSAAAATIVAGTLAERCQMAAYLCYSVLLSGWVYPIVVHAVWNSNGFLSAYSVDPLWGTGMVDFAGSGVVHVTGGTTALLATMILGPRRGRFHDETGRKLAKPRDFPGHSIALQVCDLFRPNDE
jgi:hypothetical protein